MTCFSLFLNPYGCKFKQLDMWKYFVCVFGHLTFLATSEGSTITATGGENKILQWTLDPAPKSSSVVTVLHPLIRPVAGKNRDDYVTLFSVLDKTVIPVNTDISRRVTNTDNTNTLTRHIEFTLTDVTVEDAGNYRARYIPASGLDAQDYVGVMLIVYGRPSKPIITTEAGPVVGRIMVLNCSTKSNTKPDGHGIQMNYKWYMNGADLPSDDRYVPSGSRLEVRNIQKSDENAKFMCVVFENITLSSNATYTVHVKYGPDVVSPSEAQQHKLVENKDSLQPITCSADCKSACRYQWKFNGVDIDTTDNILTINNIQRSSAGTYWCVASNDYGTKISKNVVVTVVYGPNTVSPSSTEQLSLVENTGTLGPYICSADCKPACTNQWKFNGMDYSTQRDKLIISNIQRTSAGIYWCEASNEYGTKQSKNVSVTVLYGPGTVSPNIVQQYTLIEKNGTFGPFKCSADCEPACKYQWKFNGVSHGHQGSALTISNILRSSAGIYWCLAFNDHGNNTSRHITLDVHYKPDTPVLSKSRDGVVTENDSFSLTCTADSAPLPDIIITSPSANDKNHISHGRLNSSLTIEKADCLDTGKYVCNASNVLGTASSNSVMVNVTCLPRLDQRKDFKSQIYIGDEDILSITATIIANPPAVLSWIFINDTEMALKNNTDGFVYYEDTQRVTSASRAIKSQMKSGDYGQYVLKASNTLGVTNVTFYVYAKRSPDPPYKASVDCSSQTVATIMWKSNFNGGETQQFQLKSATDSAIHEKIPDKGINLLHEARVDNLKPNTFYSFVIEAHNNNGQSAFEHLLNCTTKPSKDKAGTSSAVIGGAAGGSAALIVIILVIGVILVIKRRKQGKAEDQQHVNMGYLQDDQDDGMKQNILYESAGPNFNQQPSNPNNKANIAKGASGGEPSRSGPSDVYASVMKNKKQPEDPDVMYSVVQKSNKTNKKDEPKGKKQMKKQKQTKGLKKQPTGACKGDVYENFEAKFEEEYANIGSDPKQVSSEDNKAKKGKNPSRRKNKDGLVYIDVDIVNKGNAVKINGIHGADKKVEYVDIDFTKRADPLPSDDDDEEEADQKNKNEV